MGSLSDAVNEVSQNDSQELSQIDSPEKAKSDTVKPNNDTSATGSVKRGVTDTNVATSVAKPQSLSLSSTFNQNSPEVDYMSRLVRPLFTTGDLSLSSGDK